MIWNSGRIPGQRNIVNSPEGPIEARGFTNLSEQAHATGRQTMGACARTESRLLDGALVLTVDEHNVSASAVLEVARSFTVLST